MFRRFGTSNFTKKADGWKSKHDAFELKDASHGAACLDAFWCLDGGLFLFVFMSISFLEMMKHWMRRCLFKLLNYHLGGSFKDFLVAPTFGRWLNQIRLVRMVWNHQPVTYSFRKDVKEWLQKIKVTKGSSQPKKVCAHANCLTLAFPPRGDIKSHHPQKVLAPLKINECRPEKGTIPKGNESSSNHQVSGDMFVFWVA